MNIKVNDNISRDDLFELYDSNGWISYTEHPDKLDAIFEKSLWYASIWDGSELIGLIRCVGDGVSIVYIQDILIKPDYHRKRLGTQLINLALDEFKDIRQLVLVCDDEAKTILFYESIGFKKIQSTHGQCMIKYNFNV